MIVDEIRSKLIEALEKLWIKNPEISLEHPAEVSNGDYSTNVALAYGKELKINPRELAEQIVRYIVQNKPEEVDRVEVAGAGFINFYLSQEFFEKNVSEISDSDGNFGKNNSLSGKKVMVEYTDPNAFKPFHIGHLMANAIGESVSRLVEFSGAETVRLCYPSDIGLHIAKAVWGCIKNEKEFPTDSDSLTMKTAFLGKAYVEGTAAYEEDFEAKTSIDTINRQLFEKSDPNVLRIYEKGRKWSLDHFEELYKRLGTKFDRYIFESEAGPAGLKIVKEFLDRGVFEVSEGAIVFHGERHGLHTRVFVNSQGFPTYEAKEIGLNKKKFDEWKPDLSIIVTANEQNEYFKVVLSALLNMFPEIAEKTKHLSHGMLRLPSGKMSSRTGNVITGESLISAVEAMVHKKIEERELETFEKNKIAEMVAIGAIKYSILRQSIGSDIIYDFEKSISFEGDSGPYLQYSYVRAKSVLAKAESLKVRPAKRGEPRKDSVSTEISLLERLLPRFPEVVSRAGAEYAPHYIATYLIELASSFNAYYAKNQIVNAEDPNSPYKVLITSAFATVMKNGLWLLGISAPEKM